MTWTLPKPKANASLTRSAEFNRPDFPQHTADWARLVSLDFETYYATDYTLSKLSTSEYIRHPQFKAQMCGIKVGNGKTRVIPAARIKAELAKINWTTHSLLCHNTQFDGFILSHHYDIHPAFLYDTLSMARGLHSNEIGAGLDEVAIFYGGRGKIEGSLEKTKGVLNWGKALYDETAIYCANDVDEMLRIFKLMLPKMPNDEIELIDLTCRMFCTPVLKVDVPRVERELVRELDRRQILMYAAVDPEDWKDAKLLVGKDKLLTGVDRDLMIIRKVIGSNEKFADLLRAEGVEPPTKVSPKWMKMNKEQRDASEEAGTMEDDKYVYAFSKDDEEFLAMPNMYETWGFDQEDPEQVKLMVAKQERLQALVDVRIAVKSTTNVTRAERFITAGMNGMSLPVGYAYYRAHTGRWGGQNKMNMQNLTRAYYDSNKNHITGTGELRLSILAPKGHQIAVQDSGQIECRVNGWLWGQDDLMDSFRTADTWDKSKGVARGEDRDAYCKFADAVYEREITAEDKTERFVGKVCIAEGELVLTDNGLIPINLISKQDRLWDGVEWISHDGVIDRGIREVVTYDGLTATPDHEVFTEDGRIIPLGQAASEMARLQRTEAQGQAVRFCDDHVVADTSRKRLSVRVGKMQPVGSDEASSIVELGEGENDLVLEERSPSSGPCRSSGQAIRRDLSEMYQPSTQALVELRWAGHQMSVQDQNGVHYMGLAESATQRLQGCGDRPDGQRRALQARQLEAGYPAGEHTEPTQHCEDHVAGQVNTSVGLSKPVQQDLDLQVGSAAGTNGGANSRKVRVFDIANAGPRFRYTVSGALVLNCVLGLGYQMGAPKLQITFAKGALGGPPVHFPLETCKGIVNTYRMKNYRIQAGWNTCARIIEDMAAGVSGSYGPLNWEANTIWLPNGMALKYPDLRKAIGEKGWPEWSYQSGKMRKKIYGGLLCENLVQALARIVVGWQMLQISKKYRVVMTTHDEVVCCIKTTQADACLKYMAKWMSTAPSWCSDIPLNCEGGYAANYSK